MLNLSGLSKETWFGKALRSLLNLIPKNSTLRILQGKAKGYKWIKGAGVNGYWLGSYELPKQRLMEKLVKEEDVVFDIGAHAGFYSLLAARLVGPKGRVFAFEPSPKNLYYLRRHVNLNAIPSINVIEAAASDIDGEARFDMEYGFSEGRLSDMGDVVRAVTLDTVSRDHDVLPDLMKIDVEGGGFKVLSGAKAILEEKHPIVLLALHNDDERIDAVGMLRSLGYNITSLDNKPPEVSDEILATFSDDIKKV